MVATRQYYWIVAHDDTGKPYLIYGGESEEAARDKGLEMLSGIDFEIRKLPTRNLSRASSLLKGNRLEMYHSLKEATRRIGHNKSLKRLHRRQAMRRTSNM